MLISAHTLSLSHTHTHAATVAGEKGDKFGSVRARRRAAERHLRRTCPVLRVCACVGPCRLLLICMGCVGLCLLRGAGGVQIARGASGSAPDVADKVRRSVRAHSVSVLMRRRAHACDMTRGARASALASPRSRAHAVHQRRTLKTRALNFHLQDALELVNNAPQVPASLPQAHGVPPPKNILLRRETVGVGRG